MSVSEKSAARVAICCRKEDPFQGPKLGSCLTLRNELSEETHVLTKQEILLGKGTRVESSRVRKPGRTALPRGSQCWVLWKTERKEKERKTQNRIFNSLCLSS